MMKKVSPFLKIYIASFLAIFIYSIFFGYSFDESVFSGYAANFYYYHINPFYYWGMGAYYLGVDIASYFPSILLNIIGFHNVIVEELGVKIPIDLSFFLDGLLVYKILKTFNINENLSKIGAYAFLTSPLLFFYAPFQGNPLDFTLMLLLGSFYFILSKKYKTSFTLLGVASASYLYPIFLFPAFLIYIFKRADRKTIVSSTLILLIIATLGIGAQFISYYFLGLSVNEGTIVSGTGGAASLNISLFSPPIWNMYYFLNVLNLKLPYLFFQFVFIFVMLLPVFFLLLKRLRLELEPVDLLYVLSFQGLTFAFFSPISDPQYLLAALPFILILCFIRRRTALLLILYVSSLIAFIMVAYVTPYNFNQYFVDINRSVGSVSLFSPDHLLAILSILYSITGILLYLILRKFRKDSKTKTAIDSFKRVSKKIIIISVSGIIVFSVATFTLIAPGLAHIPNQFAYQENAANSLINVQEQNHSSNIVSYCFNLPSNWGLIPNNVKNDSNVGIYLGLPIITLNYGVIGSNDIFPFNSTHFIAETFYVPTASDNVSLTLGYINESYLHSTISLMKGNINNVNYTPIVELNASLGKINYYDMFPNENKQYTDYFKINKTLEAGNYSVIIKGTSNVTYYLGGYNGDPATEGITNIMSIGTGQIIDVGKQIKYERFSLSINLDFSGVRNVTINNHKIVLVENGNYLSSDKIITSYLKPYNIINITYPVNSTAYPIPSIYYYIPFPNDGNLSLLGTYNLLLGAIIFTTLASVFIIISIKLIQTIDSENVTEGRKK